MTVSIDWDRAEVVCGELLAAFRGKTYPYGEAWALPQTFITDAIKKDPLVHGRFLFYVCHYMRGKIKSDYAVKQLVGMWEKSPHLFDPKIAMQAERFEELTQTLEGVLRYKFLEIARFWQENTRRLVLHWNADPRRIFDDVDSADDMYRFITNKKIRGVRPKDSEHSDWGFVGFQEKMASMLAYYLMEAKLVADFSASPPVDFHLIRVMLATKMLVVCESRTQTLRYEHLTPSGIKLLEEYGRKHSTSLVELGNALWMLSVVLCSGAPGNASSATKRGEDGKKIYPEPQKVDWSDLSQVQAYLRTCDMCPVEGLCERNVYSGPYYQQGRLLHTDRERYQTELSTPLLGRVSTSLAPRGLKSVPTSKVTEPEQFQLIDFDPLPRE